MSNEKPRPVYTTARYGRVSAAVWENESESGAFYKATIEEHFKDAHDGDAWKSTHSISSNELGNVGYAAQDAARWIAERRRDNLKVAAG